MNTINIIIPEVYKNFDVINVSGGTLTFDALNKSFRNYQTTVSGNFQLSILSTKPGGDYKLLVTKNTAADVVVSLPINSVLIGDPTGSTITLSGGIGEQFLIEFSYDGINFLFILGGGSTVEPGASSGFSPNVIPFINSLGEWSEDLGFTLTSSRLTHTFTNTDYSAIGTGYAAEFKRTANTGLRLGTVGTFTSIYNSVNNVSLIQSQHNNNSSVLKINPYGGAIHIGALNSQVIIGNVTDNANSSTSVIIIGGDTGYSVPNLIVTPRGNTSGLRIWGNGNDGTFFNSMIRGFNDNILFNQQLIQIGYNNPYVFASTLSTNARLEINVAHRTMTDSTTENQNNSYYQRFSWNKGGAAADRYSYMMIGSHLLSTMGFQMKVSSNAVNFVNGNLALNPFGGNVAVGFATAPTATLHIKGNSDTVGEAFRVESLTNLNNFTFNNNGVITLNKYHPMSGFQNYEAFNLLRNGAKVFSIENAYNLNVIGLSFFNGQARIDSTASGRVLINTKSLQLVSSITNTNAFDVNASLSTNYANYGGSNTYYDYYIYGNMESYGNFNKSVNVGIRNSASFYSDTNSHTILEISNNIEFNQAGNLIGIDYDPTLFSSSPSNLHYGLLIRPNTLNGIGLGSTLPTSNLQVKSASDITGTIFKVDSNTAERFRVDSDGNIFSNGFHMFGTSGDTPQAKVDISAGNGYEQLLIRNVYTPSSLGDPNGNIGSITWDDNFIYVKTNLGWRKATLTNV